MSYVLCMETSTLPPHQSPSPSPSLEPSAGFESQSVWDTHSNPQAPLRALPQQRDSQAPPQHSQLVPTTMTTHGWKAQEDTDLF